MAIAQVSTETERRELKSCPGGFIVFRRLTFGESQQRKSMMTLELMSKRGQKDTHAKVNMGGMEITSFEFSRCIVDHNLEKFDATKFNFNDPADIAMLDPRVAEEIDSILNSVNNFEDDLGN